MIVPMSGCSSVTKTSTPCAYSIVLLVGPAIACPHEAEAVPVEPVGGRAVHVVRAAPVPHGDAVLLVTDAVVVGVVELVHLDFVAVADRAGVERLRVPVGHLLHAIDHVPRRLPSSCHPRGRARGAESTGPPTARSRRGRQLAVVVDVKVRDEDVVDRLERHLRREDVAQSSPDRSRRRTIAVPELDPDAGRAWSRFGERHEPMNVIRISSGPSSSDVGKYVLLLFRYGVGLK